MAIKAKVKGGSTISYPEGTQVGIIKDLVVLGTKDNFFPEKDGSTKKRTRIWVTFELPDSVYEDQEGVSHRQSIGKDYTLSLNEKADLRKVAEHALGKKMTDPEAEELDITTLAGRNLFISIDKKPKKDGSGDKWVVGNTAALPGAMQRQTLSEKSIIFDMEPVNGKIIIPSDLTDWIKEDIMSSDEYQEFASKVAPAKPVTRPLPTVTKTPPVVETPFDDTPPSLSSIDLSGIPEHLRGLVLQQMEAAEKAKNAAQH